jgi:hypothetical protein
MTNVEKLVKAGAIEKNHKLKPGQEKAFNKLSPIEVRVLIRVLKKVPKLKAMRFRGGQDGGIF